MQFNIPSQKQKDYLNFEPLCHELKNLYVREPSGHCAQDDELQTDESIEASTPDLASGEKSRSPFEVTYHHFVVFAMFLGCSVGTKSNIGSKSVSDL